MLISHAADLLRVLKDWREAGIEFSRTSHPMVASNSEAYHLLQRLLDDQEQTAANAHDLDGAADVVSSTPSSTVEGTKPAPGSPPYTLGELIRTVEGSERAYLTNLRTAQAVEAKEGSLSAYWWRIAAGALLFRPDPQRMPGIDRLEPLCDEQWGSGLTVENIRKLRGTLCRKLGIGTIEADAMSLVAVADVLAPKPGRQEKEGEQASSLPTTAASAESDLSKPLFASTLPCSHCYGESRHLAEGVYYCPQCRTVNDTQPWDTGKHILPVTTGDPNAVPVAIVRLHAPFRLSATPPVPPHRQPSSPTESMDVGIVIALDDEFRELFEQVKSRYRPVSDPDSGRSFYLFNYEVSTRQQPYRCVAAFIGAMGHPKAALVTAALRRRWNPRLIVMLGIAGGLDEEVSVGDVVVADVVDNYLERAKAAPTQTADAFDFVLAGEPYRTNGQLVNILRNFEFSHHDTYQRWQQCCAEQLQGLLEEDKRNQLIERHLLRPDVSLKVGHVASGSIVGAAESFTGWLRQRRDRTLLALEMEAGGLMAALSEGAVNPSLILRGISDYADERKSHLEQAYKGALRSYAMRSALYLLWALMDAGALPIT